MNEKGLSLVELMLALAVFVIGVASVAHLFIAAQVALSYSLEKTQAKFLAKEAIEEVRFIRDQEGLGQILDYEYVGEIENISLNGQDFQREVQIEIEGSVAEITSIVEWDSAGEKEEMVSFTEILTDWNSVEYGLLFDGSQAYAEVSEDSAHDTGDSLSVSFWVLWNSSEGDHDLIVKDYQERVFAIYMYDESTLRFWAMSDGSWIGSEYDVDFDPEMERWYHIVGTRDATYQRLYIDGEKQYETEHGHGELDTGSDITFGGGGYDFLDGSLDDVRIYDRALTETEIDYLNMGYNVTAGLVGHWPMNEGEGCVAFDESGNENHAQLSPDCDQDPENAPQWIFRK